MTRHAGRRFARALLGASFLLAVAAPVVQAHHGAGATDPRCQAGYPAEPGVDLSALCARQAPTAASEELDPGSSRLVPFIGAMVVTGIALAVVAVIAMRYRKPAVRPARMTRKAWWVCTACHSMNAGDRVTCYSCEAAAPAAIIMASASASDTRPGPTPAIDQPVGRPAG